VKIEDDLDVERDDEDVDSWESEESFIVFFFVSHDYPNKLIIFLFF